MTIRPLNISRNATVDSTGAAIARLGPQVYGESWRVRRMVVFTGQQVVSQARVYLNGVIPTNLIAGTYNGNQDFNETDLTLQNLDTLICVWSGASIGDVAVFSLQGTADR